MKKQSVGEKIQHLQLNNIVIHTRLTYLTYKIPIRHTQHFGGSQNQIRTVKTECHSIY